MEIRRLNDIQANTHDSYYRLYQSYLAKSKACDNLAEDLRKSTAASHAREEELLAKVAGMQFDLEAAKAEAGKCKREIENLKLEMTAVREKVVKAEADVRQWQKETEAVEKRLQVVQKDNESLVRARDGFQDIIDKKDKAITVEQQKASDIREQAENKVFELKAAFIDLQKDSEGLKTINSLLRNQLTEVEKDRNRHADLVLDKDRTIDRLKAEVVSMSRTAAESVREMPRESVSKENEGRSEAEFARLRQLTEELKDKQVEVERLKMQGDLHQRQYLDLKQQLSEGVDEKNSAKRQQDAVAYENQRLHEEQEKFLTDLGEVRQIYESQIDELSSKLKESADESIRQKARNIELGKEISLLRYRVEEYRQRLASREVDVQKLTSDKLLEMGGATRTKPTDILASPSLLRVTLDNESHADGGSPDSRDDYGRLLGRLKRTESVEANKDPWKEDQAKLQWDSLLHRIGSLGVNR